MDADPHSPFRDELGAYVLDALTPDEKAAVEGHLQICEACSLLMEDYRRVLAGLPGTLPFASPSAGARETLLLRARLSKRPTVQTPPMATVAPRAAPPRLNWQAALSWGLVGVLLIGLLAWNLILQRQVTQLSAAVVTPIVVQVDPLSHGANIALVGSGEPDATARLFISNDEQSGTLAITGLPPLAPDRTYQLWFGQPDNPMQIGAVFQVDAQGNALVPVTIPYPLTVATAIQVTEEPAPHSNTPTGPDLLSAEVQ